MPDNASNLSLEASPSTQEQQPPPSQTAASASTGTKASSQQHGSTESENEHGSDEDYGASKEEGVELSPAEEHFNRTINDRKNFQLQFVSSRGPAFNALYQDKREELKQYSVYEMEPVAAPSGAVSVSPEGGPSNPLTEESHGIIISAIAELEIQEVKAEVKAELKTRWCRFDPQDGLEGWSFVFAVCKDGTAWKWTAWLPHALDKVFHEITKNLPSGTT